MSTDQKKQEPIYYILLDGGSEFLARGTLESMPRAPGMQILLTEGSVEAVVEAETVQAFAMSENYPSRVGRVVLVRERLVVLDPLEELSNEVRQNLRMPVSFESFAFPSGGGRTRIVSDDLSCGGIAFYTAAHFEINEEVQVLIPITSEGPLLLKAQILRAKPCDSLILYAAKFTDLCHDEEAKVREAVFHIQLDTHQLDAVQKT